MIRYFSYGSNLLGSRMKGRCPSGSFLCRASMPGHRLSFPRSNESGSGVASVEPSPGDTVHGVIYAMEECDLARLDAYEGYREERSANLNSYQREVVTVIDEAGGPIEAITYIAIPEEGEHPPSAEYLGFIIAGAKEKGLPDSYIEALQVIKTA